MGLVSSSITGCFGYWSGGSGSSGAGGRGSQRAPHHHQRQARHQHGNMGSSGTSRNPYQNRHQQQSQTGIRYTGPILFYDKGKPYYEFTNFSPHAVVYKGKRYPTSEHLFQAFKFIDAHPNIAERVRTCSKKPMRAFDEAHKYNHMARQDWARVRVEKMELALELKFTQHRSLTKLLLGTWDAELIEDSPRDWFWGIGADGTGSNELGKALMRLRDALRQRHIAAGNVPSSSTHAQVGRHHRSNGRGT